MTTDIVKLLADAATWLPGDRVRVAAALLNMTSLTPGNTDLLGDHLLRVTRDQLLVGSVRWIQKHKAK